MTELEIENKNLKKQIAKLENQIENMQYKYRWHSHFDIPDCKYDVCYWDIVDDDPCVESIWVLSDRLEFVCYNIKDDCWYNEDGCISRVEKWMLTPEGW